MNGFTLSDGVIIAVIGAVSTVLVAWIKSRKSKGTAPKALVLPKIAEPRPMPSDPPASLKPITRSRPAVSPLTVAEIAAVFRSTPPFHHDKIKSNYKGVRVRWEALLSTVSESSSGLMSVSADTVDYHYLSCEARREDILSLLNAPDRTPVIIEGTLTSFGLGHADLVDCIIHLKPAVADVQPR